MPDGVDPVVDAAAIRRVRKQVEAGEPATRGADMYPAENAGQAHRRLQTGGVRRLPKSKRWLSGPLSDQRARQSLLGG